MAIHTTLPIYQAACDLFSAITDLVANMPRDYKRTIGSKIGDECLEIVVLVFRANCAQDKSPHLLLLVEKLQICELLLRFSRDKRLISTGQYAKAIKITDSIGKQANGWRRYATLRELHLLRQHRNDLLAAIKQTLDENGHLADGDVCTLKVLKDAVAKAEAA